jgi:hypothetical protein
MAMRISWYGTEHIAQYGRSRATQDATGRRHRASICPVSPRWTPWSSIFGVKNRVVALWNRFLKLAFKRHETDPLLSSSKRPVACVRWIKHRQHASWLPNGLGRRSCEGIVRPCWILMENKGPLCSSTGWEPKNEWSRTNTKGTSRIISKGCHWGRPTKSYIKLTGRVVLTA